MTSQCNLRINIDENLTKGLVFQSWTRLQQFKLEKFLQVFKNNLFKLPQKYLISFTEVAGKLCGSNKLGTPKTNFNEKMYQKAVLLLYWIKKLIL